MRNGLGYQTVTIYITKHHPPNPLFNGILFLPVTLKATSPAEERQDVTVLYNKMTLGELQDTYSLNVSVISPFFFAYVLSVMLRLVWIRAELSRASD